METACAVPFQKLPPGPERPELHFDRFGTSPKARLPVSAEYAGADDWRSPGISHADYGSMSTVRHQPAPGRRLETPIWAVRDDDLRKLLVGYVEFRAGFRSQQPGTESERLQRAMAKIAATRPDRQATLKRLCDEFVYLKQHSMNPARRKKLSEQIENLDSVLRFDQNIAAVILRLIFLYYRAGLDSVTVAAELGWKPPAVRQCLWRLRRVWARMHNVPVKPLKRHRTKRTWPYIVVWDERKIRRLYLDGHSVAAIARSLGFTPERGNNRVRRFLQRNGLYKPAA